MLTYIISGKNQIIRKRLLEELDVGATVLEGEGAYRREPVDIIMCVTRNTTGPRIKQIVHEEDRHAFMIVSSANNVFGSGFTDYEKEEL